MIDFKVKMEASGKEVTSHETNFIRLEPNKQQVYGSTLEREPCRPRDFPSSSSDQRRLIKSSDLSAGLPQLSGESSPQTISGAGHYRYALGLVLLIALTVQAYASSTLYIVAIEMISSDVLSAEMTKIKAEHLANDPLAPAEANAAPEGTCPVIEGGSLSSNGLKLGPHISAVAQLGSPNVNITLISELERAALKHDTRHLMAHVNASLAKGTLVDWSIEQRGLLFTMFTLGSRLFAVPSSRLGLWCGSKLIITLSFLGSAACALLFPILAGSCPFWVVAIFRMLWGGISHASISVTYPLVAVWFLGDEANAIVGLLPLTSHTGTALTNFLSSQLIVAKLPWHWCFYIPAIILIVLTCLWCVVSANHPNESQFVSINELLLLRQSSAAARETRAAKLDAEMTGAIQCYCKDTLNWATCPARNVRRAPNWSAILACPTIWMLCLVNFADSWYAKATTMWPTFFANIVHLDKQSIGLVTALEGILCITYGSAFVVATGKLALKRPFNMGLSAYRKWNQVLSVVALIISIALMCLLDCNFWALVGAVLLKPVEFGFATVSQQQSILDLSSIDSGLIASYVHLVSAGDVAVLPVSSYILSLAPGSALGNRFTWRLVWSLCAALKVVACVFFVAFVKCKPKSYSRPISAGPCMSAQWSES